MKKHVYRVGDKVRILRPRVVDRIGYPKTVSDYHPEPSYEMSIAECLLRGLSLKEAIAASKKTVLQKDYDDIDTKVAWLSAYLRAKDDRFGGCERSIHFKDLTYWRGGQYMELYDPDFTLTKCDPKTFKPFEEIVLSKRVVKTGTYYPPSGGYDSYSMEYDYECGGLENMKTHVIIRTHSGEFHTDDIEPVKETDAKL